MTGTECFSYRQMSEPPAFLLNPRFALKSMELTRRAMRDAPNS